jgi:glutathione S-transferase
MLTIWGRASSSNVQKVLWGCDELGLAFERHDVGREFGRNRDADYLAMNPNGLVPTLRDGDLVIWESNAILRYLATKYGGERLYPTEFGARSQVDRWLDWQLGTMTPAMSPVFWGLIRTPPAERDVAAIDKARLQSATYWTLLDHELSARPYVAGATLTLADIALGNSIHRWLNFPIERPVLPHLRAWYDRIATRPGFQTHLTGPIV